MIPIRHRSAYSKMAMRHADRLETRSNRPQQFCEAFAAHTGVFFLFAALIVPAGQAQSRQDDDSACVNMQGQEQVDACTRVIGTGQWRGKELAWAYGNRGGAYIQLDKLGEAIADLDKSITLNPSPNVLDNRGLVWLKQEKRAEAIRDFDWSLSLRPRGIFALHHRAICFGELGDHPRAMRDFDAALRLDDRNSDLWNNRGYFLLMQRDYKGAISDFDRAIRIDPSNNRAFANRGEARLRLGDISGSNSDYARSQQLSDSVPPK
jgi:tetratricopeptide (TPR) repeat protein